MQRQYSYPVGPVGTLQQVSQDWQIARVSIDNPSGLWLYLSPVDRWVPPQTIGWVVNIYPTTTMLTIGYVDAPAGGIASTVTGGPIVATVFDEQTADITGLDYSLVPAIIDLEAAIVALTAQIEALNTGTGTNTQAKYGSVYATGNTFTGVPLLQTDIIAPIPGERIYLRRVVVQCMIPINGHPYALEPIPIFLQLGYAGLTSVIWQATTDEKIDVTFDPNTVFGAVGDGIDILIDATLDASAGISAEYNVLLEYYHE